MNFDALRRTDPDFFVFDWFDLLVESWARDTEYGSGDLVRPHRGPVGFIAECTTAGTSGGRRPRWRGPAARTISDGSCVWTMRKRSDVTLPTISSVAYTISPTGIAQSLSAIDGLTSRVKFDASAAELGTYTIVAEATAVGEDYSIEATVEVVP